MASRFWASQQTMPVPHSSTKSSQIWRLIVLSIGLAIIFAIAPFSTSEKAAEPGGNLRFEVHCSSQLGNKLALALARHYLEGAGYGVEEKPLKNGDKVVRGTMRYHFHDILIGVHNSLSTFDHLEKSPASIEMTLESSPKDLPVLTGENVIGLDPIAVIVNKDSPVTTLTVDQLKQLFSGKETAGLRMQVYTWPDQEDLKIWSSFRVFGPLTLPEHPAIIKDKKDLVRHVSGDPKGIGMLALRELEEDDLKRVQPLKIAWDESKKKDAVDVGVQDGTYPLTRKLYLYTPLSLLISSEDVTDFLWVCRNAEDLIRKNGFIPVGSYRAPRNIKLYEQFTSHARRQSLVFLFPSGRDLLASPPNTKALRTLSETLKDWPNNKIEVNLLGFASREAEGSSDNQGLSARRSAAVANALANALTSRNNWKIRCRTTDPANPPEPTRITSRLSLNCAGFSDSMPVENNFTKSGRVMNRRVEVWLEWP